MTEVAFAKSFLSALDGRPSKLSPDHVEDAKKFPARGAYILPKQPKPMSKPSPTSISSSAGPSSSSDEISILIKPSKSSKTLQFSQITLDSTTFPQLKSTSSPSTVSALDIKTFLSAQDDFPKGYPVDKIRLLHSNKPFGDSKTLGELLSKAESKDGKTIVEFSVMVMGQPLPQPQEKSPPSASEAATATAAVAQGPSGAEVLQAPEFWDDLRGFLLQRVRDEKMAGELAEIFQAAWKARS